MTFFNIFSNKKQKDRKKTKIIVDHREKNSLVVGELAKLGHELEFTQLAVADYIINDIAIERKTISDFKSSIINKRIMQQLTEIKQHKKYILILEGFNNESYEGIIHENAFRGFLLSIAIDYQVPLIYTLDSSDTALYISLLAKKSPKKHAAIRPAKILMTEEERLQYILEGFPDIGPATAKKLLENFKTINNIANATQEELKNIIGKKSEKIYLLLNHKYK